MKMIDGVCMISCPGEGVIFLECEEPQSHRKVSQSALTPHIWKRYFWSGEGGRGGKVPNFCKYSSKYALVHHGTKKCDTALSGLPVLAGKVPCHIALCSGAQRCYGFHITSSSSAS